MTEESLSSSASSAYSRINSDFKNEVIKEMFKMQSSNSKMKLSDDVSNGVCKLMKIMVVESALRSIKHAKKENRKNVTLDDVEAILVQTMLDFP